jgi:transcriptional regulator with XRE-family HTH domain
VTPTNATFFIAMNMNSTTVLAELWQSVGRKIRERREELGLTQEAAGKRAKMKRQQWNRIEQGASTKRPTLFRIAKALELEPEIVLDWAGFKLKSERARVDTIEESLDATSYFERKGLSEADKEKIRPLLEVADREVERLRSQPTHRPHTREGEPPSRTPTTKIQSPIRKRDKIDEAIDAALGFAGKPVSEADRKKIREILEKQDAEKLQNEA